MEWLWAAIAGAIIVVLVLFIRNGLRNNDPLNRKAAAEICEYLTSGVDFPEPVEVAVILQRNARYKSQAKHISSMVPVLLHSAGMPWEVAKAAQHIILRAASLIPE